MLPFPARRAYSRAGFCVRFRPGLERAFTTASLKVWSGNVGEIPHRTRKAIVLNYQPKRELKQTNQLQNQNQTKQKETIL